MNFMKRALLYCRRQRTRTLILFFILTSLSAFALTGISILDAAKHSAANLRTEVGGIIRLEADDENGPRSTQQGEYGAIYSYVGDFVTEEIVKAVKEIEGVAGINAQGEQGFWGSGVNFDYIPGQFNMDGSSVPNTAVLDSEKSDPFQSGKFTLEEGRHIREDDKHVILLSKEVAERNGLKPGDMIKLYNLDTDRELELELVGIYSGAAGTGGDAMLASQVPENAGFVDFTTMQENFGREIDGYPNIDILIHDPARAEEICEQVKNLPEVKGKTLKAGVKSEEYKAISNPLESMQRLVKTIVASITFVSIIILALLLSLWTRSRKREMGILLALGKTKADIIGQLLIEGITVSIPSFAVSFFAASMTANQICAFLIRQTASDAADVAVRITGSQMAMVSGIGLFAVMLCTAAASYNVIRMKPRDILSKMD